MKGKIAFVLGAAVGYVLGTRAGRERYEQIKAGAQKVWETEPVQKGVGVVREALDERADDVKTFIRRASSEAFAAFARQTAPKPQPARTQADPASAKKSDAAEPADSPSAATKTQSAASGKAEKAKNAEKADTKAAVNSAAKRSSAKKAAAGKSSSSNKAKKAES